MAKLIDPSAQQRPVPRLIGGSARLQPPDASGAEGRGMVQLGSEIERGHDEIFQAMKVEEERVNRLRAEDAYSKLREKQLELTFGEQGFSSLKGAAAVTKPVLKEWGKRFQDAEAEVAATLSNDEQRTRFRARADVSRTQFTEDIYRHLAREGDVYAKEVFDGTMGVEQRNAVAKWDSPNDIALSLERIKQAVQDRAERYSWPAEYTKSVQQQEAGKVHSAVVRQAIATGNYKYGQSWYEKNREDIDLPTAKELEHAVAQGTQKELMNGYNRDYLGSQNSRKSLDALAKRVTEDGQLGEDRKNILIGRITNRQSVLEHRAEVAENKRLRVIERHVNELNTNTLAGFEPTPEQFAPVLSAAKGTELEPDVKRAIALADQTRVFRNASPRQQEEALSVAEASVRTEPGKFDRRVVGAWRQIYDNQRQQVKESPITFAVRQGIVEPTQPLDLSKPETTGPALVERFAIARGMQSRYSAPFKPLTPEESTLLSSALKALPPEQKMTYFGRLFKASGGDMQGYSAMMAQIAPDDPVLAAAGDFAAKGRTEAGRLMVAGQAILHPNRKEDGTPDKGKLWPMPSDTDLRKLFTSTERDAFTGRPEFRNQVEQSAKAIYAKLSVDAGDASGVVDSGRWDQAIKLASGGIERWNGKSTLMPWGYSKSEFKDALSHRIGDIVGSGKLDPSVTKEKLWDMPLEPVSDGRYMFKSGDGILFEKGEKGKPQRPVIVDLYNMSARYLPQKQIEAAPAQLMQFEGMTAP